MIVDTPPWLTYNFKHLLFICHIFFFNEHTHGVVPHEETIFKGGIKKIEFCLKLHLRGAIINKFHHNIRFLTEIRGRGSWTVISVFKKTKWLKID